MHVLITGSLWRHKGIDLSCGGDCKFWGDVRLFDVDPDWKDDWIAA